MAGGHGSLGRAFAIERWITAVFSALAFCGINFVFVIALWITAVFAALAVCGIAFDQAVDSFPMDHALLVDPVKRKPGGAFGGGPAINLSCNGMILQNFASGIAGAGTKAPGMISGDAPCLCGSIAYKLSFETIAQVLNLETLKLKCFE